MGKPLDHERNATVFASALSSLLEENQGIVVHVDGKGYFVALVYDEESANYQIAIDEDDGFLKVPNFSSVHIEDEDAETEDAPPPPTLN